MSSVIVGVLEQVPVFWGQTQGDAVRQALELAERIDGLGYRRFWVAEHHGGPSTACASPATLVGAVGARTTHLRVGSGGVLLPYHNPLAVAEAFRLLEALFPGRIDLGIARGPGASEAARVVFDSQVTDGERGDPYLWKLEQLLGYLGKDVGSDSAPVVVPTVESFPAPWLLGSSARGAKLAGLLGLPFSFAQFAHGYLRPDIVREYRRNFQPSPWLARPHLSIAVRIACAETQEKAEVISRCVWMVARTSGWSQRADAVRWAHPAYPDLDTAASSSLTEGERALIEAQPFLLITGDPATVCDRMLEVAEVYAAHEIMVTTICPSFDARLRTFELVADVFATP